MSRIVLCFVLAAACTARSYRPTRPAVGWDDAIRVRVDHLDLVTDGVSVTARVAGDASLGAIRLSRAADPPCRTGKLASQLLVDGVVREPVDLVLEGERTVEATFLPDDVDRLFREGAALDLDTAAGCVRVPLVRADGVVEWVEEPRWSVGGAIVGFGADAGAMRRGGMASLRVSRVLGRFEAGGEVQLGRADGREPWDHVDLLGAAPVAGVRLVDLGRWAASAAVAYDLIAPAGSSPMDKRFLSLVHGPRVALRLGYGGEPVRWPAFRSRRSATMFGVEVSAARWVGNGWMIGGGLVLSLGR
jgi:hypothetical protein